MIKKIILFLIICQFQLYPASKEILVKRIDNLLSKLNPNTKASVLIYNPLTQDTLFNKNYTESMIPASNTKLFTTATALSLMGGDFTLSTKLFTNDLNITDSIINGNLYLKGYGNSVFTIDDLTEMILKLKLLGIKKVTGHIVGDDSFFDDVYTRDDWINDEVANVKLPPISALVLDRNRTVIFKKYRRTTRRYVVNVKDPPVNAAIKLKEELQDKGITVENAAIKGETPLNAKMLARSDIRLRDLIKIINKHSDNFLAECLFKTIGAVASGKQGNAFYSTQAILSFLSDNGIYSKGSSVVDGSGISRYDQITAAAITSLLEKMYFDLNNFEDFYNSLSIAGVDGTLQHRLTNTPAQDNFHGKTGTLNGVSSISGYLKTEKGEDIIICIIFEYKKGGANYYRNIQDEIIETAYEWN